MSEQEDKDVSILKSHAAQLAEHFDSVQILVTRHSPEDDGTINVAWGAGNWFARIGQVREWLLKKDEESRVEARRKQENDDDE